MSLKIVHTDQAPAAIGPYSQGIVANGFLFTAGQIAIDPATGQVVQGDVVAQTERVMTNLAAVLDDRRRDVEGRREDDGLPAGHERLSRA